MWGWFGGSGSAQARKEAPKKAILALRQQLDMLQKREKHLENQMAEQDAIARKNVSTNKTGKELLPHDDIHKNCPRREKDFCLKMHKMRILDP